MDKFITIMVVISGCILGIGALLYTFNSITRLFKYSVSWIEELCIYSIVLMVFLMQAKLEFHNEQLSISVLADKLKNKPILKRILYTFKGVVTIFVCIVLFRVGLSVIKQNLTYGVLSPVLGFPMGLYFLLINICLMMVILCQFVNIFTKKIETEDDKKEVTENV